MGRCGHGTGYRGEAMDDREAGDILDEPHDCDGDEEPELGWPEGEGQGPCVGLDVSPIGYQADWPYSLA